MADGITRTITIDSKGAKAAVAALARVPNVFLPALLNAADRAAGVVLGKILRGRLSGHGPYPVEDKKLGVVSRRLSRSLRVIAARPGAAADGAVGLVSTFTTPVKYWAPHEFGFIKRVNVKRHYRRAAGIGAGPRKQRQKALKRALLGSGATHDVRAHKRLMELPKREPVQAGVREHVDVWVRAIRARLRAEAVALVGKEGGGA